MKRVTSEFETILNKCQSMLTLTQSAYQECQQTFDLEKLADFSIKREGLVTEMTLLFAELVTLQNEVCQVIGVETFSLPNIQHKVSEQDYLAIANLMTEIKKVTAVILELGEEITSLIEKQQEATRLALHAFYEEQRIIRTYHQEAIIEPIYIDKLK